MYIYVGQSAEFCGHKEYAETFLQSRPIGARVEGWVVYPPPSFVKCDVFTRLNFGKLVSLTDLQLSDPKAHLLRGDKISQGTHLEAKKNVPLKLLCHTCIRTVQLW